MMHSGLRCGRPARGEGHHAPSPPEDIESSQRESRLLPDAGRWILSQDASKVGQWEQISTVSTVTRHSR